MNILAGVLLVIAMTTSINGQDWLKVGQMEYYRSVAETDHAGALDSCSALRASLAIFQNETNIARVLNGSLPVGSNFYAATVLGSMVHGDNAKTGCLTTSNNSKSYFMNTQCNATHRYLCMRTVGASWGAWGSWEPCEQTCRPAEARRFRNCTVNPGAIGTDYCTPVTEYQQKKPCNQDLCAFTDQVRVNLTQCNATCESDGQELQHFVCAVDNKIVPEGCRHLLWEPCRKTCVASTTVITSGFLATESKVTSHTTPTTRTASGTSSEPLKAGILIVAIPSAIGGLIILIVLLVLGLWFLQRMRRSNKMSTNSPNTPSAFSNSNGGSVELVTQVEIVENRHAHTYDSTPNENEYDTPTNDGNSNDISSRQRNLYDRVTEENEYDVAREEDDVTTTATTTQQRLAQMNGSHNYASPQKRRIPAAKYEEMSISSGQHCNSLKSTSSANNGGTPLPVDGQYDTLEEVKEAMGKINAKANTSREVIASAYEVIPDLQAPVEKHTLSVSGEYDVISHEGAPRKKFRDYASLKLGKDGNASDSSALPGPQNNANHESLHDDGMTDNILYKPASM